MHNANLDSLAIHVASSTEEMEEILRFRYEVYAAELKMDFAGIDHSTRSLTDALDSQAVHMYARLRGDLVGAVRVNLNTVPAGLESSLQYNALPRPFAYCSRFFVLKEWRGAGVMECLTKASFSLFRDLRAEVAICHCYPKLVKLYKRMGFELYGTPFVIPNLEYLGAQAPMRCVLVARSAEAA